MDRAQVHQLQPYYIASFFQEAFALLGGRMRKRENNPFQITFVPAHIRQHAHSLGLQEQVLHRYE